MKKFLLLLTLLCACVGGVLANNIRIVGLPVVKDQNVKDHTVKIKFDLAWDNSWRTSKPDNYDAAWLFVKCWDGESWNHVYLEETGAIAGSKTASDAVTPGLKYSVTSRDGSKTDMDMMLEPGYSMAWKKWHLDPKEDSVKCVVGYFLYRKDYGAGHVVVPGITFLWNYGNQGFVDEDDLVVKVFAVEMVYVPTGDYYLGGRGTATSQVGSFTSSNGTTMEPLVVTSEKAITVSNNGAANTLWALNGAIKAGTIPAEYPKGHQAFYIMKYELTQEAYCEFLNSLNQGQQQGRVQGDMTFSPKNAWAWGASANMSAYRNYVKIKQAAPFIVFGCDANLNNNYNETDSVNYDGRVLVRNIDGQDLAMNLVSFNDLLAYAEFAGLRPMTELEYEKACRGTREPVNDEYAWGSVTAVFFGQANLTAGNYSSRNGVSNLNTGTEIVGAQYNVGFVRGWTNSLSCNNAWWKGGTRTWTRTHTYYPAVLRVGIFADSTSTRAEAGATFWGVMNMSDNVSEMCISAVSDTGRKFTGVHGCGQLDPNGAAFCKGWNIVDHPSYYILRGMIFTAWTRNTSYSWGIPTWWTNCPGLAGEDGNNYNATAWAEANVNELYRTLGNMNHWEYYAGMISARHQWNHSVAMSNRGYNTNPADAATAVPHRGIRCVRTAKAEK